MRNKFVVIVLLIVLLEGCTGNNTSLLSPIQSPLSSTQHSYCTPTDHMYGAVTGNLYLISSQPAEGSILYLGEYLNKENSPPTVVLDISRHPHTRTNEKGEFCFPSVPPGNYGLIVWDAAESVLLTDINTNNMIIIQVKAGTVTNVGEVYSPIP